MTKEPPPVSRQPCNGAREALLSPDRPRLWSGQDSHLTGCRIRSPGRLRLTARAALPDPMRRIPEPVTEPGRRPRIRPRPSSAPVGAVSFSEPSITGSWLVTKYETASAPKAPVPFLGASQRLLVIGPPVPPFKRLLPQALGSCSCRRGEAPGGRLWPHRLLPAAVLSLLQRSCSQPCPSIAAPSFGICACDLRRRRRLIEGGGERPVRFASGCLMDP